MRASRSIRSLCSLAFAGVLISGSGAFAQSFVDHFDSDSTGTYTQTLIDPSRGTATFDYDAAGMRARILEGDNFGLRVAHSVPARSSGRYSVDLSPTVRYPSGGTLTVRLVQDASNYYVVTNTSGSYAPGTFKKVVAGQVVATASFATGYAQNVDYTVRIDFAPGQASVHAFGQTLALSQNTPLDVTSFEIEAYQQDLYVDTILYGDEAVTNHAPIADAGFDLAAAGGDIVTLDASASTDPDGVIASYLWQQLSGTAVALSGSTSATPAFTAPDPGSSIEPLIFQVTVADAFGATASDSVRVDVWPQALLGFSDDFSSNTTGDYETTLIDPQEGTAAFVYDAQGQRARILTGNDFGMRVARELPPRSSGRFAVDLLPTLKYPGTARLSVRLVQDANNYYVLTNMGSTTPGTLTKVVGGVVVDTVTFVGGYTQNTPYNITIDFSGGLVVAAAFGQVFALEGDATTLTIDRFEIEAYQQDVYFDNVSYSDFGEHTPSLDLIQPAAGLFQTSNTLRVEAAAFLLEPGWSVVFAIDAGLASEILAEDATAPYLLDIPDVPEGTHSVDAYVVDANGSQVVGPGLHDQVSNVAIGDYYVGVGDSITKGTGDNLTSDNISADGRNSGGGYEPILNDLLTSFAGYPHTVKNEGVGGRTSLGGANKINSILAGHPVAQFMLILFGTNDSGPDLMLASGLGLFPGDPGYAGSYKANMQTIINAVVASGKLPILAKVPIAYGDCSRCKPYPNPETAPRNALIRQYNQVIDELVVQNALPIAGPDLYTHYAQHPEQMKDRLHPNGVGYQAMADLWADALLAP